MSVENFEHIFNVSKVSISQMHTMVYGDWL